MTAGPEHRGSRGPAGANAPRWTRGYRWTHGLLGRSVGRCGGGVGSGWTVAGGHESGVVTGHGCSCVAAVHRSICTGVTRGCNKQLLSSIGQEKFIITKLHINLSVSLL